MRLARSPQLALPALLELLALVLDAALELELELELELALLLLRLLREEPWLLLVALLLALFVSPELPPPPQAASKSVSRVALVIGNRWKCRGWRSMSGNRFAENCADFQLLTACSGGICRWSLPEDGAAGRAVTRAGRAAG